MSKLGPSPYAWLSFDSAGKLEEGTPEAVSDLLRAPDAADLVVISHGWKNNKKDAAALYETLWNNVCGALTSREPENVVVAGVLWPAKEYETDFDDEVKAQAAEGHVLAIDAVDDGGDLSVERFKVELDLFEDLFGSPANAVRVAAEAAGEGLTDRNARALLRAVVEAAGMSAKSDDSELHADRDPYLGVDDPRALISQLIEPPQLQLTPDVGSAQSLGDFFNGLARGSRAAVARFLNQTTYYEMKKRAGIVGTKLGAEVLPAIRTARPTRLHLVGHSFGARLVTATANTLPNKTDLEFFSLTLLQGAFSHNGLAEQIVPGQSGAFWRVIGRPTGPISITHTHNDRACTLWYALASRLSRDFTAAVGDKDDKFGAMGANGAQKLKSELYVPEHVAGPFKPVLGKVNGFLADAYIKKTNETDAHNNVTNADVGRLVAAVIDS